MKGTRNWVSGSLEKEHSNRAINQRRGPEVRVCVSVTTAVNTRGRVGWGLWEIRLEREGEGNRVLPCSSGCWIILLENWRAIRGFWIVESCERRQSLWEDCLQCVYNTTSWKIVVVQSLSHARLLVTPWTAAQQASLSFTLSRSLLKLLSIESVMPSHSLSPPSPFAFSQRPQHQGLFQWVVSLHQEAQVLELQFQHQSFQWIFRTDFL